MTLPFLKGITLNAKEKVVDIGPKWTIKHIQSNKFEDHPSAHYRNYASYYKDVRWYIDPDHGNEVWVKESFKFKKLKRQIITNKIDLPEMINGIIYIDQDNRTGALTFYPKYACNAVYWTSPMIFDSWIRTDLA